MQSEQTQAEKKILTEFKKLSVTHKFVTEIFRIRKLIGIPESGLPMSEGDWLYCYFPLYTPTALRKAYPEEIPIYLKDMNAGIKRITANLKFCNELIEQIIRCYIYYNVFLFDEIGRHSEKLRLESLCNIVDTREEFQEAFPVFPYGKFIGGFTNPDGYLREDADLDDLDEEMIRNMRISGMIDASMKYPVSLQIHGSASQRDITDYVRKNWKYIKAIQERYHNKSGLTFAKTKMNQKILERNELIYQNRDKTAREISKLLQGKNYPDVDIGSIGKIISLEKKKREKK